MGCSSSRAAPVAPSDFGKGGSSGSTTGGLLGLPPVSAVRALVKPTPPRAREVGASSSTSAAGAATTTNTSTRSPHSKKRSAARHRVSSRESNTLVAAALRAKRYAVIHGVSGSVTGGSGVTPPPPTSSTPKPDAIVKLIRDGVKSNFLFAAMGRTELGALVDAMEPWSAAPGTVIMRQGERGDYFYVVESGLVSITVDSTFVGECGEGTMVRSFGELALLFDAPRAATVTASGPPGGPPVKLWRIGRQTFRSVVARVTVKQHNRLRNALRHGVLQDLTSEQLDIVADAATIVHFAKGDQIIRKGEKGEVFYIIETGSVICRNLGGKQANNVLQPGDYFGERALLTAEPRAADVYAETDVTLVALHADDFTALLGHLHALLEHNLGMRLLLCVPILAGLDDEQRSALFTSLSVASYDDGMTVLAAGEVPNKFFIVKQGGVSMSGEGLSSSLLVPGNWFPDDDGSGRDPTTTPSPLTYVAMGPCECFITDGDTYRKYVAPLVASLRETARAALAEGRTPKLRLVGRPEEWVPPPPSESPPSPPKGPPPPPRSDDPTLPIVPLAPPRPQLTIPFGELQHIRTVGTGTFGRVKIVQHGPTGRTFALKALQKAQIVALKQEANILSERDILGRIDHPFIIRLFQTVRGIGGGWRTPEPLPVSLTPHPTPHPPPSTATRTGCTCCSSWCRGGSSFRGCKTQPRRGRGA